MPRSEERLPEIPAHHWTRRCRSGFESSAKPEQPRKLPDCRPWNDRPAAADDRDTVRPLVQYIKQLPPGKELLAYRPSENLLSILSNHPMFRGKPDRSVFGKSAGRREYTGTGSGLCRTADGTDSTADICGAGPGKAQGAGKGSHGGTGCPDRT